MEHEAGPKKEGIKGTTAIKSSGDLSVDEEEIARIIRLQDELFQLEKQKAMEDKRTKETKARLKEIRETSSMSRLIESDVEDLDVNELIELVQVLARVQKDINDPLNIDKPLEVSGQVSATMPPLSISSWYPQITIPPRHLPWTPLKLESSSLDYSTTLLPSTTLAQAKPLPLQPPQYYHKAPMIPPPKSPSLLPQTTMIPPPQAASLQPLNYHHEPMMTLNEAHQYYSLPQEQQLFSPQQVNVVEDYVNYLNPVGPPQVGDQHTNSHNFAAIDQPSASYQLLSAPVSPNFNAQDAQFGIDADNGAQAVRLGDMQGPSDGLYQQDEGDEHDTEWAILYLFGPPLREDNSGSGGGSIQRGNEMGHHGDQ